MTLSTTDSNLHLCHAIAQRIAESPYRRIPFVEYMDLALYHPQYGYYATNQAQIGVRGDFFTSPHLGRDFGELLAEQLVEMWHILDQPKPFMLVEMGAGQGILAGDILRYLQQQHPDCFAAVEYLILETASGLIAEQKRLLQRFLDAAVPIQWTTWQEIPTHSIVGCCFSNELVDAFPVHLVTVQNGDLQEVYITTPEGSSGTSQSKEETDYQVSADSIRFVEVTGDLSTSRIRKYFELIEIAIPSPTYPDGYRSEVNLAALDWMTTVSDRLHRGYLLTIDYGYPASRYYSSARNQGTLQCYYQHAYHSDPYVNVGRQDITAHVNFTALERQGDRCGLQKVGATQQGLFLMALGLGDRISALSTMTETNADTIRHVLQRRQALHDLANPMGLGNFGVLVQSKGLSPAQQQRPLKGFTVPPLI